MRAAKKQVRITKKDINTPARARKGRTGGHALAIRKLYGDGLNWEVSYWEAKRGT